MHALPRDVLLFRRPQSLIVDRATLRKRSIVEPRRVQRAENCHSTANVIEVWMRQDESFEPAATFHYIWNDRHPPCVTGFPFSPSVEQNPSPLIRSKKDCVSLPDIEYVQLCSTGVWRVKCRRPGNHCQRS